MRFDNFARTLGQAFASAIVESGKFEFSGESEGVPLAELDLTGAPPTGVKVTLSRKDCVRILHGETFAVAVEGDEAAADALRFNRNDESLRLMRTHGPGGPVEIIVTLPALSAITIGGSGRVVAERLGGEARISIGGSGDVFVDRFEGESLSARIGGSGRIAICGAVSALDLTIGGSGNFEGEHLEVENASIRIGGSGSVALSSDGEVTAKVGGAGDILIHGNARCSLKAGGAGKLRCVPRAGPGPIDEAA